jgi:hypothetical protein
MVSHDDLLKKNYNLSTTAFLQHNVWYNWGMEVSSELYSKFVCKLPPKNTINEFDFLLHREQDYDVEAYYNQQDGVKKLVSTVLQKQMSEPFVYVITFYLLEKFFENKKVNSTEFKRFFLASYTLASKMFEDIFCSSSDYFHFLELSIFGLQLEMLVKDEFNLFSFFNHNLFVEYGDMKKFIQKHSTKVGKKVVEKVSQTLKSVQ